MADAPRADFFVSYNEADERWAEWVADTLEGAGYSTVLQKWDFRPGSNFVLGMDEAAARADRTILILSPDSLASQFAAPEWAAAFIEDPKGSKAKLVPVKVAACSPTGLLQTIVVIDLVDLDEETAIQKLLSGVGEGRRKPRGPAPFPGRRQTFDASSELRPTSTSLWRRLEAPVEVEWQVARQQNAYGSRYDTSIELQLVPIPGKRVEVRRLAELPDDLIEIGRRFGLLSKTAAINQAHDSTKVVVQTQPDRTVKSAGLVVTRSGQRGAWWPVPRDSFTAVFDPDATTDRISTYLQMLATIPGSLSDSFAAAVAVASPSMMIVGSEEVIGNRNGASGMRMSGSDIVLEPDDSVSAVNLRSHSHNIAAELTARLSAAINAS